MLLLCVDTLRYDALVAWVWRQVTPIIIEDEELSYVQQTRPWARGVSSRGLDTSNKPLEWTSHHHSQLRHPRLIARHSGAAFGLVVVLRTGSQTGPPIATA